MKQKIIFILAFLLVINLSYASVYTYYTGINERPKSEVYPERVLKAFGVNITFYNVDYFEGTLKDGSAKFRFENKAIAGYSNEGKILMSRKSFKNQNAMEKTITHELTHKFTRLFSINLREYICVELYNETCKYYEGILVSEKFAYAFAKTWWEKKLMFN